MIEAMLDTGLPPVQLPLELPNRRRKEHNVRKNMRRGRLECTARNCDGQGIDWFLMDGNGFFPVWCMRCKLDLMEAHARAGNPNARF